MSGFTKFFDAKQFSEGQIPTELKSQVVSIPRNKIRRGLIQYRLWFDPERIEALAEVFRETSFIGALILHPDPVDDGYYRLIGGERSWLAGGLNGMEEMPAFVERNLTETQIAELAFSLNSAAEQLSQYENTLGTLDILSRNLNVPLDQVTSLLYGMDKDLKAWRKANKGYRGLPPVSEFTNRIGAPVVEEVFGRIAITTQWPGFVSNWMPLLNLPEPLKSAIVKGQLAPSKASALSGVDPQHLPQLIELAAGHKMSLAEVKAMVGVDPDQLPQLIQLAQEQNISLSEAAKAAPEGETTPTRSPRPNQLHIRVRSLMHTMTKTRLTSEKKQRLKQLLDEWEQLLKS